MSSVPPRENITELTYLASIVIAQWNVIDYEYVILQYWLCRSSGNCLHFNDNHH